MKRRAFVLGSFAVTGGLAIGYVYPRLQKLPPKLPDNIPLKPGETAITPYVVIDGSGITLIAPRAEMGQGIRTGLAALVAEELDVALEDVAVIHGPPSELYSNREMFGKPRFKGRMHRNPTQFTGAQSSTRDAYVKMRRAGAAARSVLVEAAARKLGVEKAILKTGGGGVTAPDGRRLSYVELAQQAAKLDLPENPPLKTRDEWKILGNSQQRVDMPAKCTGTAVFGVDVSLPEMLHATVIRNPGFDGGLLALDPKPAEAMQGVEKVIPVENGVIVVATNTWLAFEAAKAVDCKWGTAPYPLETEGHFDLLIQEFAHEPFEVPLDEGDVDSAIEDAEVISGEYRVPYLAHATMEPMNATAQFKDGRLTLWAGVQNPTRTVRTCAELAKIDEDDVTLVSTYLGCGFGRRLEQDVIRLAVRAALEMEGRPVKLILSREEDIRQDAYRPLAVGRFRAGLNDGRLDTLEFKVSVPSLHNRNTGKRGVRDRRNVRHDRSQTIGLVEQRYRIDNRRVSAYLPPNLLWVGFWRGVAETQNTFFHESAMDEIAHAAGRDPLEMRLSLIDHRPSLAVLEAVADMSDWGKPMPKGHARGLAYAISSGAATAQVIEVHNGPKGIEVQKAFVAVDVGVALDPRNIHAQLESALIFGLTAAVMGEITVSGGGVTQSNFVDHPVLRMNEIPKIETQYIESNEDIYGVGEASTPTVAPALGNAIFAATGRRIRELPFNRSFRFALSA